MNLALHYECNHPDGKPEILRMLKRDFHPGNVISTLIFSCI